MMLIKLINCAVAGQQKSRFSTAQQAWQVTKNSVGFIGQLGGWQQSANQAIVLACWQDQQSLDNFMVHQHDDIYDKSGQKETYLDCKVDILEHLVSMSEDSLSVLTPQATIMRLADCEVLPGRRAHFIDVQKSIWNPAMTEAKGMLGGHFCQFKQQPNRFLVCSLWQDKASHEQYVKSNLPHLKVAAKVSEDIIAIKGAIVDLQPSWFIPTL